MIRTTEEDTYSEEVFAPIKDKKEATLAARKIPDKMLLAVQNNVKARIAKQ